MWILLFAWAAGNVLWAFSSLLSGLQVMGVANALQGVQTLIFAGLAVYLVPTRGLLGLAAASAASQTVVLAAFVYAGFRHCPRLRIGAGFVRRSVFRKLLNFGAQLKVTSMADMVCFQTDKILISHFLGMAPVTDYHLGSSAAGMLRSYPTLLVSAVTPAASELHARREAASVQEIYRRSYKYVVLAAMPLSALLFFNGRDLMQAWMGSGFPQAVLALRFFAVGYLVNVLGAAGASIGAAIDRPDLQRAAAVWMAALNVILSLLLVARFGFPGILAATTFSLIVGHLYHAFLLHANLELPLLDFWRKYLVSPLLACVAAGGVIYLLGHALVLWDWPVRRMTSLALFFARSAAFVVLYGVAVRASGYIDGFDRDILRRVPVLRLIYGAPAA
jgi:O-antigen/teichoic acid export membrane protein